MKAKTICGISQPSFAEKRKSKILSAIPEPRPSVALAEAGRRESEDPGLNLIS